MNSIDHI